MRTNAAEERESLERVLAGKTELSSDDVSTIERLATLHLEAPSGPASPARALELANVGLQMVGTESPFYPKLRHLQAMALRSLPTPPPNALGPHGTAADADRDAWKCSLEANARDAYIFANDWGQWAWDRNLWDEAAEAYSNAQRAHTRVVLSEPDLRVRMGWLSRTSCVTRGAYALSRRQDYKAAVVLLEQTNLDAFAALNPTWQHEDIGELEKVAPALAGKLNEASKLLWEARLRKGINPFSGLSPEEVEATRKLNRIVEEIRHVRGFEAFAGRPTWDGVVEATRRGPVTYLVPTDKGSVAICVYPGEGAVTNFMGVDMPATSAKIGEALTAFVRAEYDHEGDRMAAFQQFLDWLGSNVTIYLWMLIGKLPQFKGHPGVLIPFGLFDSLPLQLGNFRPDPSRPQLIFIRNHTYAYSCASLVASRRRSGRVSESPQALIVANPHLPPEFNMLVLADAEAAMVKRHLSAKVLSDRQATAQAVLELLPGVTVAHFICHGAPSPKVGYSGTLSLAGSTDFGYEELRTVPGLSARLVVLSACTSGFPALGVELGVNLPTAFLAHGAAGVLGTFWHTDELASLLLLTRFYDLWLDPQSSRTPAEALGLAQTWLAETPARDFRKILSPDVLSSPASQALKDAKDDDRVFANPWYWGGFFVVGE